MSDKGGKGGKGDKGDKGDKGGKGDKGDKGDKGNKGDKGGRFKLNIIFVVFWGWLPDFFSAVGEENPLKVIDFVLKDTRHPAI